MSEKEKNRVALMGIIVETKESVHEINKLLHTYSDIIVGRMGIPYHKKNISIISIVLDAPVNTISALSGKLGMLNGVSVKTQYSK
ncbi:MAG: hypothetical protein GX346_03260 [Clostridiales bacterium]|nr:hypothetical protein [Clostridiales bacterium]